MNADRWLSLESPSRVWWSPVWKNLSAGVFGSFYFLSSVPFYVIVWRVRACVRADQMDSNGM